MVQKSERFIFRKYSNIGASDAIEDKKFLHDSFIDNGEIEILTNCDEPQCLILGRTGSGKTALIETIKDLKERVLTIAPEELSLTYLSNNSSIKFFVEAGVNMDLFYRLLWRHVFAVEIIKAHYKIVNEQSRDSFLVKIRDLFMDNKSRTDAVDYLMEWGEEFWKESEYRVKEITQKIENDLGASLQGKIGTKFPGLDLEGGLSFSAAKKLTKEEKAEIVNLSQPVVDRVQIKLLSEIMNLLNEILDNPQKMYYITIDRLDENWISEDLRYHLIRALIDTIRDFNNKIKCVKIIAALRIDLLERMFRYTRGVGYQEEKYKSMYLRLSWKDKDLISLIDQRVTKLVREQYTKKKVTFKDLLPDKVDNQNAVDYFLSRTLYVPRDVILFFNLCINRAEGKAKLNQTHIINAATEFSTNRFRSLADEWAADYPNLIELAFFLKGFPIIFEPQSIKEDVEKKMMEFLINPPKKDYIFSLIEEKFHTSETHDFIREMVNILYRVGIVGIRQGKSQEFIFSYEGKELIKPNILVDDKIKIHKAFYAILGIRER